MKVNLTEQIVEISGKLDNVLDSVLELFQRVPAEITVIPLDDQAGLIIELRNLKDLLKGSLKPVNKILASGEQRLCQTIANDPEGDGITYQHSKGTVTATARGFFSVSDPSAFYEWLRINEAEETIPAFVRYVNSKRERTEYCEELLRQGLSLPDGVKEHIIASVTIRRKSDG